MVTEPTPWDGGLAGVNSFGFGGANCHVLLSSNPKVKVNNGLPLDDLPRLVCTSGRTEEAVEVILSEVRPLLSNRFGVQNFCYSYLKTIRLCYFCSLKTALWTPNLSDCCTKFTAKTFPAIFTAVIPYSRKKEAASQSDILK